MSELVFSVPVNPKLRGLKADKMRHWQELQQYLIDTAAPETDSGFHDGGRDMERDEASELYGKLIY